MLLFQLAVKQSQDKSDAILKFADGMRDIASLAGKMISAGTLEQKMETMRSLVAGNSQLAKSISGNKELSAQWNYMNQTFDSMVNAKMIGATHYTSGNYGFTEFGSVAARTLYTLENTVRLANVQKRFETSVQENGFTYTPTKPADMKLGSGYDKVMDKLDGMLDAMEENRPDIARSFATDILGFDEYKKVLKNSPEFRNQFENALYGLSILTPGSPEGAKMLEKLQSEFNYLQGDKVRAGLASVPTALNTAQKNVILADAYNSLQEIRYRLVKAALLERTGESLKANDTQTANELLSYLSLAQDVKQSVVRYALTPERKALEEEQAHPAFAAAQDNAALQGRPLAKELGLTFLPDTPEARFAKGSDLDAINQAVLAGNVKEAKALIAGTNDKLLYNKSMAQQSQKPISPDIKSYSDRLQMASLFGVFGPSKGALYNLVPFYTATTEAIDASKDAKTGDYSKMGWHIAAAAGYLVLDLAAIYTGGISKSATALLKQATVVERLAAMGGSSKKIANALDDLSVLLKEASIADDVVRTEKYTAIQEKIKHIKTMTGELANEGRVVAKTGKEITLKGGIKEIDLGLGRLGNVAKTPAKLQEESNQLIRALAGEDGQIRNIGIPEKLVAKTRDGYLNLEKRCVKMSSELEKTLSRTTNIAASIEKIGESGKTAVKSFKEAKPLLSSEAKEYLMHLNHLDDNAKTLIKKLKDGQHITIEIEGNGMKGSFAFVKKGETTLVYRASEYDEMLKGMSAGTTPLVTGTKSKAGKAWDKKLDELVPAYEYTDLATELSKPTKKRIEALEDGREYTAKLTFSDGATGTYTFVKKGEEILVYEQSVYRTYKKQFKTQLDKAKEKVANKYVDGQIAAKNLNETLTGIPKWTVETFGFKPKEWRGLKPVGFDSWGWVPKKINQGTNFVRDNALSTKIVKGNLGGTLATENLTGATALHGWRGVTAVVGYPVRAGLGTLSGTGRLLSYPIQAGLNLGSGVVGAGLILGEGVVGVAGKSILTGFVTLGRQNASLLATKLGTHALQNAIESDMLTPNPERKQLRMERRQTRADARAEKKRQANTPVPVEAKPSAPAESSASADTTNLSNKEKNAALQAELAAIKNAENSVLARDDVWGTMPRPQRLIILRQYRADNDSANQDNARKTKDLQRWASFMPDDLVARARAGAQEQDAQKINIFNNITDALKDNEINAVLAKIDNRIKSQVEKAVKAEFKEGPVDRKALIDAINKYERDFKN